MNNLVHTVFSYYWECILSIDCQKWACLDEKISTYVVYVRLYQITLEKKLISVHLGGAVG